MKEIAEKDTKINIANPPDTKRARMEALKPCGAAPDKPRLSSTAQLNQFRAAAELCQRRSASAAGNS